MKTITKINTKTPLVKKRKKVAAYARVSMKTERLSHSLSAQISRYNSMIQRNPEWEFAGVFADGFISGTNTVKRDEFQRMIEECEAGNIELILTKSISRFARNTVDLLETVRHLKDIGVEVWFENENIHTFNSDGELLLTILASFAQAEVESISSNVKWIRRKNFEKGIPQARFHVFGYRWEDWTLVPEPDEAEVVKGIYEHYLNGEPIREIVEWLAVQETNTQKPERGTIDRILTNPIYKGAMVLQKSYVADSLNHYRKMNRGELPMFVVEDDHEAIIEPEVFDRVQQMRKERKDEFYFVNNKGRRTCFTSKIRCGHCGVNYQRHKIKRPTKEPYIFWWCRTKAEKLAKDCPCKGVPEPHLRRMCIEVLGTDEFDEAVFSERIDHIVVNEDDSLTFVFKDGSEIRKEWEYTAKEEAWKKRREAGDGKTGD